MNRYIGTKLVNATPMNRQQYNDFRGWVLPDNEDGADEGYLVETLNGGKANTAEYKGYVNWLTKDAFDKTYRKVDGMTFSDALRLVKMGVPVRRAGWNGKGLFIFMVQGSSFTVNRPPLNELFPEGTIIDYRGHIDMKTVDGSIVPWVASQTDLLGEDWEVVE